MRKILFFTIAILSLASCSMMEKAATSDAGKNPNLKDYGKFFKVHGIKQFPFKDIYKTVWIDSISPKNVVVSYRFKYVSSMEVSRMAQYHCQKIKLDAVKTKEFADDQDYPIFYTAYFECK